MAGFSSPTVRRVQDALATLGLGHEIVDLGLSARTAADAAGAVGCRVDQIAKSLVFRLRESGRPLLVVTSGDLALPSSGKAAMSRAGPRTASRASASAGCPTTAASFPR